jgi:enamidase
MLVVDAPLGGTQKTALDALKNGDPISIGAVISSGIPRFVGRSNNTPPSIRKIRVEKSNIMEMFE